VFIQVTLNLGRTVEVKKALYARIAENLAASPGLRKDDVLVSLVEVPKENWSFGGGVMSYPPDRPPGRDPAFRARSRRAAAWP
jgi:phenylpyruvate tautomerase PptA (4-oxalocrotonate tautomerase family)